MSKLDITPQQIRQTINDRHLGLVNDGRNRIIALRWFTPDLALLVDSTVTRATSDFYGIRFHSVRAQLAVWVDRRMPAGLVTREMALHDVMHTVAKSFELSVSCHPERAPDHLYAGPWDGKLPHVKGGQSHSEIFVAGSFDRERRSCELVWALDATRYLSWFAKCLAPKFAELSRLTPQILLRAHQSVLETLFGITWFKSQQVRHSKHPAHKRWRLAGELLTRYADIRIPRDLPLVHGLLEIMADTHALVECTGGDRHSVSLGALANYGDEAVTRRLENVIVNPTQFLDVLLELNCAAWHLGNGHEVRATEERGMPDLRIKIPDWNLLVFAECKRISARTGDGALKRAVNDANAKLKRAEGDQSKRGERPGFGVLYLDISVRAADLSNPSDAVPKEVAAIEAKIAHLLRYHNRSVSAAITLWRDNVTVLPTQGAASAICAMRYRSSMTRHRDPRTRLPLENTAPLMVQQTVAVRIDQGTGVAGR